MNVVIKIPGQLPSVLNIRPFTDTFEQLVGGYVKAIELSDNIALLVNEFAELSNLPPNFFCPEVNGYVQGTVVVIGCKPEGGLRSLSDPEIDYVKIYLAQCLV